MTYDEQVKNPKGVLYWDKRYIKHTEWRYEEGMGFAVIHIPYRMDAFMEYSEKHERISTAAVIRFRGWDKELDYMFLECEVKVSAIYVDYIVMIVTTRNNDVYNYLQRIKLEQENEI